MQRGHWGLCEHGACCERPACAQGGTWSSGEGAADQAPVVRAMQRRTNGQNKQRKRESAQERGRQHENWKPLILAALSRWGPRTRKTTGHVTCTTSPSHRRAFHSTFTSQSCLEMECPSSESDISRAGRAWARGHTQGGSGGINKPCRGEELEGEAFLCSLCTGNGAKLPKKKTAFF